MSSVTTSPSQVKSMVDDTASGGALVKHAGQVSRITTPDEFRSYLDVKRNERWHLLSPATDFGSLPQHWALVPTVVTLDPDPKAADVYADRLFCSGDEVALTAVALSKIANAGGSIIRTIRLDDGRIPYLWAYKAIIRYRSFVDALWKEQEAEKTYDLRDGMPAVVKMLESAKRNNRDASGQIAGARLHGQAGAESRAINRAIRKAFSLKQKYTRPELSKPFVAFNLVFQPDANNPQHTAAVLQNAFGGTELLYPGGTSAPALPAPAPPMSHASEDAIDGETVSERVPAQPADAVPLETETDRPLFTVRSVMKAGTGYYLTTTETADTPLRTDDLSLAKAAKAAMEGSSPVLLGLETRNGETWIIEFQVAAVKL